MKKINTTLLIPSAIAIAIFLIATVLFFKPIFFDNKKLAQGDVNQWQGSAKELADFRAATGQEPLWASSTFSGMPAYLISVQWSTQPLGFIKRIITLWMPSGANNIFMACVCYYIMLLAFRVRPYLAIIGALAFAFSSFMLIGLVAGHNARIGAMALIPLVITGIHLSFTGKRILGFGITAAGIALHLRENHLQVTYYLLMIVAAYGLMQLVIYVREKKTAEYFKTIGLLIPAAILAAGTTFGQLWAVSEYTKYSTRGKNELVQPASSDQTENGLGKEYAFRYSNGILEPLTTLVPNFYGGSSFNYLVQDKKSETYQALANSSNNQLANQLAQYSSSYWGAQPLAAPYYGGAIIFFLAIVGILFAERKYIWWLVPISVFAIMLSWGKSFEAFNYFLFDHLPGYNKFRSVTFGLVIMFFAMPLLGMLGLEKLFETGITKETRKKLWIAFGVTGGVCLLLAVFAGMFSFMRDEESTLPNWFLSALREDRKSLMRGDALRSFFFIAGIFIVLYFNLIKKVSPWIVCAFIGLFVVIDLMVVDSRYISEQVYKRKRESTFTERASETEVLKDKSYYRVYNSDGDGRASYFFQSLTGYNGAPLRRYQDLMDSCLNTNDMAKLSQDAQRGSFNFGSYSTLNMLNCKYIIYGEQANQFIVNEGAAGPAWFVRNIVRVNSPNEELAKINETDTRVTAVIDVSKFNVPAIQYDSTSTITNIDHRPNYLKYESESQTPGLGVFSEIYYPEGWIATIDGAEASILRVNYALRALEIPAGKHTIEFKFEPKPYVIGNKVTAACSWILLLVLLGSIGWSVKKDNE